MSYVSTVDKGTKYLSTFSFKRNLPEITCFVVFMLHFSPLTINNFNSKETLSILIALIILYVERNYIYITVIYNLYK